MHLTEYNKVDSKLTQEVDKNPLMFLFDVTAPSTATAVSTCSNLLEKTTVSSGVIRSNYKSQYSPNANCQWTLSVSSDATLELVFHKFTAEVSRDVVHVYDGGSTSSPLIGNYSGTSVPDAVNSSSNQFLVIFTSDSLSEYSGFVATYHGMEYTTDS